MKNLLLIIDPQNDFCSPGNEQGDGRGALYVPGAHDDMIRLSQWILANYDKLDHIIITLDTHHLLDISHPQFWVDLKGNHPTPFTTITASDVEQGKWRSVLDNQRALDYLKKLEAQGLTHTIWPPHCLLGSTGAAIYTPLLDAILLWASKGHFYQTVQKGSYVYTEHFGVFQAQVPYDDVPETQLNKELLKELEQFDRIILAGEARSHCVGTSLKQIIDNSPHLVERIIILEDAMSNVPGFNMEAVYKKAMEMGATTTVTEQLKL